MKSHMYLMGSSATDWPSPLVSLSPSDSSYISLPLVLSAGTTWLNHTHSHQNLWLLHNYNYSSILFFTLPTHTATSSLSIVWCFPLSIFVYSKQSYLLRIVDGSLSSDPIHPWPCLQSEPLSLHCQHSNKLCVPFSYSIITVQCYFHMWKHHTFHISCMWIYYSMIQFLKT